MTDAATGPGIAAVILAAGAGQRLGGVAKALLPHPAGSYLAAIAATARAVGLVDPTGGVAPRPAGQAGQVPNPHLLASLVDAVVVVGAPFGDEVAAHARQLGLRVRVNPAPERGMASSVALGFAAIAGGPASAAWLWPVDHPAVTAATLRRLVAALDEAAAGGGEVARPRFRGIGGHPPLIARAVWPALAACADRPEGARGVLRAARVVAVEVDDPGVIHDVDTPADREALPGW